MRVPLCARGQGSTLTLSESQSQSLLRCAHATKLDARHESKVCYSYIQRQVLL